MTPNQPALPFLSDSTTFSNGIIYRSKYKNNKHETPYLKVELDKNRAYYSLAQFAKLPDMSSEVVLTQGQAELAFQLEKSKTTYTPTQPDVVIAFILKNAVIDSTGPIRLFKSKSVIPYLLITSIDMNNMRHYDSKAMVECEGVYGAVAVELKKGTDMAKSLDPTYSSKEEVRETYVKSYDNKELPTVVLDGLFTTYMLSIVSGVTATGNYYDNKTPNFSLLPEIHSIYTDCIEFDLNPGSTKRLQAIEYIHTALVMGTNPGEWTVDIHE